jgi:hypothetical protein
MNLEEECKNLCATQSVDICYWRVWNTMTALTIVMSTNSQLKLFVPYIKHYLRVEDNDGIWLVSVD